METVSHFILIFEQPVDRRLISHGFTDGFGNSSAVGSEEERVIEAFFAVLSRPASPEEIVEASQFLASYQEAPGEQLSARTRVSAWSALARTLLTRNEFLFVD